MRRTLVAVLITLVSFAVAAGGLVWAFQAISGPSTFPTDDASTMTPAVQPLGPGAGIDAPSTPPASGSGSSARRTSAQPPSASTPHSTRTAGNDFAPPNTGPVGVLADDFRKLGIDDPTTAVDESVSSACDVVGATIAGPVLCAGR